MWFIPSPVLPFMFLKSLWSFAVRAALATNTTPPPSLYWTLQPQSRRLWGSVSNNWWHTLSRLRAKSTACNKTIREEERKRYEDTGFHKYNRQLQLPVFTGILEAAMNWSPPELPADCLVLGSWRGMQLKKETMNGNVASESCITLSVDSGNRINNNSHFDTNTGRNNNPAFTLRALMQKPVWRKTTEADWLKETERARSDATVCKLHQISHSNIPQHLYCFLQQW